MEVQQKERNRFKLGASFALLLLAWWITWPWPLAAARGRLAAHFDLMAGRHKVLAYGLQSPWRVEYFHLLEQRYDVHMETVAFCIVSKSLVSYTDNYNQISATAVNQKHGHDIFQECYEDAKRTWENRTGRRLPE